MTRYNESPENLVEINLWIDCFCYIPQVGQDGIIRFIRAYPAGDSSINLSKVKVPSEVVGCQEKLTDYLRYLQQDYDFVDLDEINIWDEDAEKFLF